MQIGKEAGRDNRLDNCLRPERGRRQAAIGQRTGNVAAGNRPNVGQRPATETSLPIVQMSAINQVVA